MKSKKSGWYRKKYYNKYYFLNYLSIMKTITLKTQDDFFEQINQMALEERISKSALIRKAITDYHKRLERQKIVKQMQDSSFETRGLDDELIRDFEAIDDEYLLPPWEG
ncbi:MAG: hypothetical protein DSY43_04405 [Gammaproteobacteria bacterium]|nr:MAG: hypothetical protein DSY43_04405 [Gammaproteobacteria bacterium]